MADPDLELRELLDNWFAARDSALESAREGAIIGMVIVLTGLAAWLAGLIP